MLRVITGTAKGRKLISPESGTRPLTDRIKTVIFDLIKDLIPESHVLDLFAGSGAFGIEALSRGAAEATFVDIGNESINCIETNLANTKLRDKAIISKSDVNDFMMSTDRTFDIIFLDPPFDDQREVDLPLISRVLKDNGLLIFRTVQNKPIDKEKIPFEIVHQKIIGVSKVIFLKKK